MKLEELKKDLEKLGIEEKEIDSIYSLLLEEEKKLHPDLSEEDQEKNAVRLLRIRFRRQLRSPAVPFEGIVLGATGIINTTMKRQQQARDYYKENPQKAVDEGFTDEDGNPLDNLKVFSTGRANPNYGRPLKDRFLRNVFGVAIHMGKEERPRPFFLTLNDEQTKMDVPINKPVKFRAIDRTPDGSNKLILNGSTVTKFEKIEKKLPDAKEIIEKILSNYKVELANLREAHEEKKEDPLRIIITEGDVVSVELSSSSINSRVILDDESIPLIDENGKVKRGTTCWVPAHIPINFSERSRVLVIGQTGEGAFYDEEERRFVTRPGKGEIQINVLGIIPLEGYTEIPEIRDIQPEEEAPVEEEKPEEPEEEEEKIEIKEEVEKGNEDKVWTG